MQSNYGPQKGPWDDEPNQLEWQEGDFTCVILRHHEYGHLTGNVGVPFGHPLFKKYWCDIEHDAIDNNLPFEFPHFGLDYSGPLHDCYLYEPIRHKEVWFFGFHCTHPEDRSPYLPTEDHYPSLIYRTIDYVKSEIDKLIILINNYTQWFMSKPRYKRTREFDMTELDKTTELEMLIDENAILKNKVEKHEAIMKELPSFFQQVLSVSRQHTALDTELFDLLIRLLIL